MAKFRNELECYLILANNYDGRIGSEDCSCLDSLEIPKKRRILRCKRCGCEYDPRYRTVFDRSNTDLGVWFYAIDRWNDDMDYNANKLSNETGVTNITASRIMKRVRRYLWHKSRYEPTAGCEIVVKRERRAKKLDREEFLRPARTYKKKEGI